MGYRIPSDWKDHNEFLEKLAQKSGKLLKGGEADINTVAKMVLNDWQRGKIPYFVPPVGCEMPPKAQLDEEIKKDQDFKEIKVVHEYDPEDLQDMSIGEENQENQAEVKSENQSEDDVEKSEIKIENPESVSAEPEANEVKKRKFEEEDQELPLDKKRKTEPTELVQTGSGVFVVTDSKK